MNEQNNNATSDIISQRVHSILQGSAGFLDYVDYFFDYFMVGQLLSLCGGDKKVKVPYIDRLKYLVKLTFKNRTYHADFESGLANVDFSIGSVNRLLDDPKIDWIQLTTILALMVFKSVYDPSLGLPVILVIDDTTFKREKANYCEGFSFQRDHNSGKSYKGYRLVTLSLYWNDLTIPINCALVSTTDDEKILWPVEKIDNSPADKRRNLFLRSKATEVCVYLTKIALSVGFPARMVLFDSWFTYPGVAQKFLDLGLDVVGMLKAGGNPKFRYDGELLNAKEIYEKRKIWANREGDILFQVDVDALVNENSKTMMEFPMTMTYCRNRHEAREYFCILSTCTGYSPEYVLEYYEHRWSIEQFFKDSKNPNLMLLGGTQALSLTKMSAYISVVLIRYMVIFSERAYEGKSFERSIQSQFYLTGDEIFAVETAKNFFDGINEITKEIVRKTDLTIEEAREIAETGLLNSKGIQIEMLRLPSVMFDVMKDGDG